MEDIQRANTMESQGRQIGMAVSGDDDLGPFKWLPGTWENSNPKTPQGWNMIALPFSTEPDSPFNYRLLLNHYNEKLEFTTVDKGVPNRGLDESADPAETQNQFIVTLDYLQTIEQVAAVDVPESDDQTKGKIPGGIHHEPGLFLNMTNFVTKEMNIARLGTIPHGNSVLAMGNYKEDGFGADVFDGVPAIPTISGLPVGIPGIDEPDEIDRGGYLDPYGFFNQNPFLGTVPPGTPNFPGFNPVRPARLLQEATAQLSKSVKRTTRLGMRSDVMDGGIKNIPFITREANATLMESTFWIMELDEEGIDGDPALIMMYLQSVNLDFFPRVDGTPGLIGWPHVSINTLVKTANPPKN